MIYTAAWIQIFNVGLTIWVDTRARHQKVAERDATDGAGRRSSPAVKPPRPDRRAAEG